MVLLIRTFKLEYGAMWCYTQLCSFTNSLSGTAPPRIVASPSCCGNGSEHVVIFGWMNGWTSTDPFHLKRSEKHGPRDSMCFDLSHLSLSSKPSFPLPHGRRGKSLDWKWRKGGSDVTLLFAWSDSGMWHVRSHFEVIHGHLVVSKKIIQKMEGHVIYHPEPRTSRTICGTSFRLDRDDRYHKDSQETEARQHDLQQLHEYIIPLTINSW